jgi:hypothetical protein
MTAYYYGDTPKLSDEEFSLLKEELIWNGSKVGVQHKLPSCSVHHAWDCRMCCWDSDIHPISQFSCWCVCVTQPASVSLS